MSLGAGGHCSTVGSDELVVDGSSPVTLLPAPFSARLRSPESTSDVPVGL